VKKIFLYGMVLLFILCSCTSTNVTKNTVPHVYTNNEHTEIEILGEVYFESKDRVGYVEILKMARNLYPECHFVIDIMIDQIVTTTTKTTNLLFRKSQSIDTSIVWIMRGTAVKYKNVRAFNSLSGSIPSNTTSTISTDIRNNSIQPSSVIENTVNYTVIRVSGTVERGLDGVWVSVKIGDILNSSTHVRVMTNSILVLSDGNREINIPAGSSHRIGNIIQNIR